MKNLKKEFPATQRYTYLNTAASGLLSQTLLNYRQEHDLEFLEQGSVLKDKQGMLVADLREHLSRFFNCPAGYIALVPNFSFGFNAILEGLSKSNKVLLLDKDYPSINRAVEARGFKVCYATIDAQLEDHIIHRIEQEKPQVFIFSMVQYINGIKLRLKFLNELKARFPDLLLIADGTQYLGSEYFDFAENNIDIMGASAYKWMNAAYGNAFFLFKNGVEERIDPRHLGFGSTMGKYKSEDNTLIGKLEPGHLDTLNFGSLLKALELIESVGFKNIERQVNLLAENAFAAFSELNLLEESVVESKLYSSIFNIKGDESLFDKLLNNDIICSQRGSGLRISFHYYNTTDDLDRLLDVLKS